MLAMAFDEPPLMQAIAEVNDKLSQNVFRRVLGTKVVSELSPASDLFIAENYHQKYLERGGRFGSPQNASKVGGGLCMLTCCPAGELSPKTGMLQGATEKIRCYG